MTPAKNSLEKDKETRVLKELLIEEIFFDRNELALHKELSSELRERLERSNILSKIGQINSKEGRSSVNPWLRTRLFESVAVDIGLESYLGRLLDYEGKDANSEVKIPGLLGAFHIITSVSPLINEAIHDLEGRKRISLDKNQKEVLRSILDPTKTYQIGKTEASFSPFELEDIRSEISRFLLDQMARPRAYFPKRRRSIISTDNLLEKPIPQESIENVSQRQVISIAQELVARGDLKLCLLKDGIIWEYKGKPPVLIARGSIFILPRANRILGYSNDAAAEQALLVSDFLKRQVKENMRASVDLGICVKCNEKTARKLAYHKGKGRIISVCEECYENEKDLVVEVSITPKGWRWF